MADIAIENTTPIVDLPIQNGDFPVRKLLVYQRVYPTNGISLQSSPVGSTCAKIFFINRSNRLFEGQFEPEIHGFLPSNIGGNHSFYHQI